MHILSFFWLYMTVGISRFFFIILYKFLSASIDPFMCNPYCSSNLFSSITFFFIAQEIQRELIKNWSRDSLHPNSSEFAFF